MKLNFSIKGLKKNKRKLHVKKGRGVYLWGGKERDWNTLLGLFFVLLAGILFLNLSIWYGNNASEETDDMLPVIQTLDRSKLSDVLKGLSDQEFLFNDLRGKVPNIKDPSV